jgi:hypothetical protein
MNVPVPPASDESSTMRHENAIEPPVGSEVISNVAMSNEDSVQPSITTNTKRERELTGECWQKFEPIREDKKLVEGKYLICKKIYTYKSLTGTLLKYKKNMIKMVIKYMKNTEVPVWSKHSLVLQEDTLSMTLQKSGEILSSTLLG